jgi:hypothetical protein
MHHHRHRNIVKLAQVDQFAFVPEKFELALLAQRGTIRDSTYSSAGTAKSTTCPLGSWQHARADQANTCAEHIG